MRRTSFFFTLALLAGCGSSGGDGGTVPPGDDGGGDVTVVDGAGAGDARPASDGPASGNDGASSGGDDATLPTDANGDDATTTSDAADGGSGDDGGDAAPADASDASSAADSSGTDAGDASPTCGPCVTPPDACHAKVGTCVSGQCTYAFVNGATCDDGDPCTIADSCVNDGCFGTPMICDTPPAAVCNGSSQAITHDQQGSCVGGLCSYKEHVVTCSGGPCVNGACTSDPCAGVTCNAPPSVCYTATGATCSNGSCSYPFDDGASCDDGNACTTNDTCATGACKGTPIACSAPPANMCANGSTLKAYAPHGTCGAGKCSYSYSFVDCPSGCANGACNPSGWTTMTSNTTQNLWAMWGSSANAVWAVGGGGTAVFYDGAQWQVRPVPAQATSGILFSIHGSAPNDVFALAQRVLIKFDGSKWGFVTDLSNQSYCTMTTGVFATGDANDDVYVSCWWGSNDFTQAYQTLYEVVGSGPNAGKVTQVTQANAYISCVGYAGGVWSFGPKETWLAGCTPSVWNGSTLSAVGTTPPGGAQIWAANDTNVFTIAYDENQDGTSIVQSWNGSVWQPLNTGLNGTISAISGTSGTRVFAAGYDGNDKGAVEFYDGTGFTSQVLPANTARLQAIYAAPTGEVFAAGLGGVIVEGP